jgi:predicted CoA-binding protein
MPDHDYYPDGYLRKVLGSVRTIAMVGASPDWHKASSFAMKYLQSKGYRVIPVNPRAAGKSILGETCYARLSDIPQKETGRIDMVDIFRNSEAAGPIADEAIAIGARVVWMQLGVRNDAAAARAEKAGLIVVMNRCPKIEYGRLSREIRWAGVNTRTLSAKRPHRLGGGVQRLRLGPGVKTVR